MGNKSYNETVVSLTLPNGCLVKQHPFNLFTNSTKKPSTYEQHNCHLENKDERY